MWLTTLRMLAVLALFSLVGAAQPADTPVTRAEIAAWGDSLTVGYYVPGERYPTVLSRLTRRSVFNGGVASETSVQIADRFLAAPKVAKIVVIWAGRNDYSRHSDIDASIARMVGALSPGQHYLVLGTLNAENEGRGTEAYRSITEENAALAATYGDNYVPVREALVALAHIGDVEDAANKADDIPPRSVRSDYLHLNAAGNAAVAGIVADIIAERGW
jgi:lysophospholipase L1-like esterase